MLTTLFVQIAIMSSAVLGIISHNPHVIDSLTSETPVSLLETLLDQIYKNGSRPSNANITEMLQPKLEELFRKPLLEFMEEKMEKISQTKAPDDEKNPFLITFTDDTVAKPIGSSEKKSTHGSRRQNTAARRQGLPLENNEKSNSFMLGADRESLKENPKLENNRTRTSTESSEETSKKYSKKMQYESWKEKFQDGFGTLRSNSFRSYGMKTLNNTEEKQRKDRLESSQTTEKKLSEVRTVNRENKKKIEGKAGVSRQNSEEIAQLKQALQLLTQLKEHPLYISRSTSAETNKTDGASDLKAKNSTTALVSHAVMDSVKWFNGSNMKGIRDHFHAEISDSGKWFEPLIKNVSYFKENSSTSADDDSSDDSAITDKKIELFQNSFLYRKLLYSILASYPIFANWSQAVSAPSFNNRSSKFRSQNSHYLPSDSSYHPSNSITESSDTKQMVLKKKEHLKENDEKPSCLMGVSYSEEAKPVPVTSLPTVLNDKSTQSEAMKSSLHPNVKSLVYQDQPNLLSTSFSELDKTKSLIDTTEVPKLDAITCIIPRLNTSIFYGYMPEPVNKEPKSSFGKFFNKRNKKKKMNGCTSTTHLCTPTECSCRSTTTAPFKTLNPANDSTLPDTSLQLFLPKVPTKFKMQHEPEHKTNHEENEDNKLYDEGINKILEDISTKMCLPDMINKLLEVLDQNKTNSLTAKHSIPDERSYQDHDCNHKQGGHNNHAAAATRLGSNESKKRWVKQSHSISRDEHSKFQKRLPDNYHDKNLHPSTHLRLKSKGNENEDLSNLLFFIGVNKGQNNKEDASSQENYFDLAYLRS